jgi:hypothetical protein
MRNMSNGIGLALISACILCAAGFSARRLENTARASVVDEARGGSQTSGRGTSIRLTLESEPTPNPSITSGGCEAVAWFDATPREFVPGCGAISPLPLSPADVNGDGLQEVFAGQPVTIASGIPVAAVPTSNMVLWSRLEPTEGFKPVRSSVSELPLNFASYWLQSLPDLGFSNSNASREWRVEANPGGWIDADGDGDLDLVVQVAVAYNDQFVEYVHCTCPEDFYRLIWRDLGWKNYGSSTIWLENIGFQGISNRFDLDGNGEIDTADVALVLLNFGTAM